MARVHVASWLACQADILHDMYDNAALKYRIRRPDYNTMGCLNGIRGF